MRIWALRPARSLRASSELIPTILGLNYTSDFVGRMSTPALLHMIVLLHAASHILRPIYIVMRPAMRDMVHHPGESRLDFGLGNPALIMPSSNSRESLAASEPNNTKQPARKVNAYSLTKKLNTKIQFVASKLTEIFVWTRKISECSIETLPLSFVLYLL